MSKPKPFSDFFELYFQSIFNPPKRDHHMSIITLGKTYRDKITGFRGVATGYVQYISGCNQVLIQPSVKDGALVDSHWFDVQRLEVDDSAPIVVLDNGSTPGCDRAAPKR